MPIRSTNTFAEGLVKILQDLAQLKVAEGVDDSDLEFIIDIESQVLTKIREPQDQLAAMRASQSGAGSPNAPIDPMMSDMGMPPGPPMSPMGMPPDPAAIMASPGQGANGLSSMPSIPPPDELRRLLPG